MSASTPEEKDGMQMLKDCIGGTMGGIGQV